MDSLDLVRAMKLLLEIPTLRQDTKGWTAMSSDAGEKSSKVNSILILLSKYTSELTFEDFHSSACR